MRLSMFNQNINDFSYVLQNWTNDVLQNWTIRNVREQVSTLYFQNQLIIEKTITTKPHNNIYRKLNPYTPPYTYKIDMLIAIEQKVKKK